MNKFDNKNQPNEAVTTIHALSHDGRGIATIDNKTAFVAGSLPQEKVTYQVTKKRSHYLEAEAMQVIESSSERVTPPCQHFGVCGGCSLQHMNMATQLELKQKTLLEQLQHFGHVVPEIVLPPLTANEIGYRRKARLGVKFVIKKNKMLVGFREKKSHYLADLENCAVLHPKVGARLLELSQLIASLEAYKHIPQIEVAMGDDDCALVFRHMETLSESDKNKLIAYGKEHQFHIYLQPNPPEPITKCFPDDQFERLKYTLPDHQLEFLFHPLDFTQINLEMNRLMVNQAIELLDPQPNERILDLFCGIGNFTLPLARRALHVTGVEGSKEMVSRAYENASHNQIKNVDFYTANLLESSALTPCLTTRYDAILLDPPRVGAKELLPLLEQIDAQKIVYVSCNPATLARDAGELVNRSHYLLKKVGIMNMFPHTSHIEAMAVFQKG